MGGAIARLPPSGCRPDVVWFCKSLIYEQMWKNGEKFQELYLLNTENPISIKFFCIVFLEAILGAFDPAIYLKFWNYN